MVSLPYSRTKRYLSGIDWVIGSLDHLTRGATGAGVSSQVVLELERPISKEDLRRRLRETAQALPVLAGRPARDINLAPYWQVPKTKDATVLDPVVHEPESESPEAVLNCLTDAVNTPFPSESRHLAFHAIYPRSSDRCLLAMVFDHRLFDARGAEMFLDALQSNNLPSFAPEPAHLDRWLHRFRVGRHVNRTLAPMSGPPIDTIPIPPEQAGRKSRFALCCLDSDETGAITEIAENSAGYLMFMPYVLAVTIQRLHAFLERKGHPRGNYVVPVSTDIRSGNRPGDIFFNHLSFLLLHVKSNILADRNAIVQSIKQQMYRQAQLGLQQDLWDVTMLMRISPVSLLARIMLRIRLMLGSFSFSCVGESAYRSDKFLGARVLNLFHMPRVPTPPAYGLFFNKFDSCLNMVLSYMDGMMSDDDAYQLLEEIRADLHDG